MPLPEKNTFSNRGTPSQDTGGYTKILAMFNPGSGALNDASVAIRSNRVKVILKHELNYEQSISATNPESFYRMAGGDLSTIFMPYETVLKPSGIPCFHPQAPSGHVSGIAISAYELRPFQWDISKNNQIYNRYAMPSGDGLSSLLSGETYRGNADQLRDISDIRGIGFRFPMMGIGWGYDLDGQPAPSGHGKDSITNKINKFKGEVSNGWQVDPLNYIAAPVDFRYDALRHVWTTPQPQGSGRYKVYMLIDDGSPATMAFDYVRFY